MTTGTSDTTDAPNESDSSMYDAAEEQESQSFTFEADAKQLQTALRGIQAWLCDDTRPTLAGAHVTLTDSYCMFEATDGFGLYRVHVKRHYKGGGDAPFCGFMTRSEIELALVQIAHFRKMNKHLPSYALTVQRERVNYPNTATLIDGYLRADAEWLCLNSKLLRNVLKALGGEEYIHISIPKDGKNTRPAIFRRPIHSELDKDAVLVLMPMYVRGAGESDRRPEEGVQA